MEKTPEICKASPRIRRCESGKTAELIYDETTSCFQIFCLGNMSRTPHCPMTHVEPRTPPPCARREHTIRQTHADVSGVPLRLTREPEACVLGSAVLAAVGAGIFPDIFSAIQDMVHVERTVVREEGNEGARLSVFGPVVFVVVHVEINRKYNRSCVGTRRHEAQRKSSNLPAL